MTGRPFPLLVADFAFEPDPRGIRAFSCDDRNLGLPTLPVGTLVWTRDLADPGGTEMLAEIWMAEPHSWPTDYWAYYLRRIFPPVRVADLAVAAGCTVEEFLGGA